MKRFFFCFFFVKVLINENMKNIVLIALLMAIADVGLGANILIQKNLQKDNDGGLYSDLGESNYSKNFTNKELKHIEFLKRAVQKSYNCDFEDGLCSFLKNNVYNGGVNWILGRGKDVSAPSFDHTLGNENGSYLFVNLTALKPNSYKLVELETITLKEPYCLRFFYYMHGIQNIPSFDVSMKDIVYFQRRNSQGDRWKEAILSMAPSSTVRNKGYQATFSSRSYNSKGYLALDDIELTPGDCQKNKNEAENLCTFDEYSCGYASATSSSQWKWITRNQNSSGLARQPKYDHTLNTEFGGYWITGINSSVLSFFPLLITSTLNSPVYTKPESPLHCLHFYFWLDDQRTLWGNVEEAYIEVHIHFPDRTFGRRQWLVTKSNEIYPWPSAEWTYVETSVNITEKFQLQFTSSTRSKVEVSLALDDITFSTGNCSKAECNCGLKEICSFKEDGSKLCSCWEDHVERDGKCEKCDCGSGGLCSFNEVGNKLCTCNESYAENNGRCQKCDCGGLSDDCEFINGKKECKCHFSEVQKGDGCVSCYCGPNGKCSFDGDDKKCDCDGGFINYYGFCKDCECGLNRTCTWNNNYHIECGCEVGFVKNHGLCSECDCGSKGECSFDEVGNKSCSCHESYVEKDGTCEKCDCGLKGLCSFNVAGNKLCACNESYAEKDGICQKCDCGPGGICSFNEIGNKLCTCNESYADKDGICEKCNCGPNGKCRFFWGLKECECDVGFGNAHGFCSACNCGQNISCSFTLRWNSFEKSCICPEGYQEIGHRCEEIDSTTAVGVISTANLLSSTVNQQFTETTEWKKMSTTTPAPDCDCGEKSFKCVMDVHGKKTCFCHFGYAQMKGICSGYFYLWVVYVALQILFAILFIGILYSCYRLKRNKEIECNVN